MSHRRSPRPASGALRAALERAAPKTRLAAVQAAWSDSVGERVAAVTEPVSAEELDLMQEQLLERLRERLGDQAPQSLRFRMGGVRK
jgi:predicted nucleic acid-binding Zn ribbon protein